ncbi:hypothetical protein OSTOST_19855, partial [Ostertagia ostertagi]
MISLKRSEPSRHAGNARNVQRSSRPFSSPEIKVYVTYKNCGFLHRDIKPPNFAIGREEDNSQQTIFILDFGLCRRY